MLLAHAQPDHPVDVLLRGAEAVDARHRAHHDHVATGQQRVGGAVPQPLDLLVHRGVLLDVGVGLGHVRLGLVVVVVGDEVLDGVVGEQLPQLVGELRGEGLVGLHHEDRPLHLLGHPRHRRGLAGTGGAEEDDVLLAAVDALDDVGDGGRLVAAGRVVGDDLERRDTAHEVGGGTHAASLRRATDNPSGRQPTAPRAHRREHEPHHTRHSSPRPRRGLPRGRRSPGLGHPPRRADRRCRAARRTDPHPHGRSRPRCRPGHGVPPGPGPARRRRVAAAASRRHRTAGPERLDRLRAPRPWRHRHLRLGGRRGPRAGRGRRHRHVVPLGRLLLRSGRAPRPLHRRLPRQPPPVRRAGGPRPTAAPLRRRQRCRPARRRHRVGHLPGDGDDLVHGVPQQGPAHRAPGTPRPTASRTPCRC